MPVIQLTVKITCPQCQFTATQTMPTDRCEFFYECTSCHTVLRAKPGACCVYCSYGDRPCPARQESRSDDHLV